jgi:hypothetical protein
MAATQTVGWIRSHGRKATAFALFALVLLTALAFASSSKAAVESPPPPSVWSDKADYAPGELVTLSGANWAPGEAVHIRVNDDAGETWRRDVDVTADESGAISDHFNLPDWFVATYSVTATGASSGTATWSFTDSNPQSITVTPASVSVAQGTTANYTVNLTVGGNTSACNVTLAAAGLPASATATFGTNPVPTTGSNTSTSLSISTTASTPTGSFTITVSGTNGTGCQGPGPTSGSATLIVTAGCTAPAVTTQPINQSVTYGASASFTAAASGSPAPTVKWQVNAGSGFADMSPAQTSTTLTLTKPGVALSGNQYRAVFTNTCGGTQTATSNAATLTVAQKTITITPDSDQTKVYGTDDPTLTYTNSPALETGDSFTGSLGRAPGQNVGSYAINLGTLSAGANYSLVLSTPAVNFAITTRPITVKANDVTRTYGNATPAFSLALTSGTFGYSDGFADLGTPAYGFDNPGDGVNVGAYRINVGDLANTNYAISYATGTNRGLLTITKADQTITVDTPAPASKVYNTSFTVAASSSSGLAVSYSASGVCSNTGATFTMTSGTGTCTVHYNQAGNDNYNAAPEETEDVEAAKADQTITFVQPTSPRTFGESFNVAPTATSGLAVSVAASGGCTAAASGGGYSVEMTSGTTNCVLTASQAGNANYNAASDVQRTVVAQKAPANLAFDLSGLSAKTFGDDDFSVASYATSNSPAAKQFVLGAGSSGCTVTSGGLVHITGAAVGTDFCVISVSQDATANYLAGGPVSQSFHIAKANQTITFAALSPKLLGDPPFVVSATGGDSGNPVTFSAGPSSICTSGGTNGATITITGVGTCTVTANQAGNSNYNAAGAVSRTFGITYLWTGFLQPINDTAHQTGVTESKFKLGQTIPAKFVLKNALGTVVQQSPNPTFSRSGNLGACDSNAIPETITEVVTPDNGVTYSWDGSQYHYNWSTKGLTSGEYRIYANLADGSKRYVDICLTK